MEETFRLTLEQCHSLEMIQALVEVARLNFHWPEFESPPPFSKRKCRAWAAACCRWPIQPVFLRIAPHPPLPEKEDRLLLKDPANQIIKAAVKEV